MDIGEKFHNDTWLWNATCESCLDLYSNKSIIKQQQENEMTKMTENQGNLSLEVWWY